MQVGKFVEVQTMPYKGGDLNLRLAGISPSREPGPGARRADSMWWRPDSASNYAIAVDDAVLASCNCAYDVARFHGSGEVRLEHLLHALTRVPAAAHTLTTVGINTDLLRRDTAVAIAIEPPAGSLTGDGAPQASPALDDTLRRAADHTERPLQPVSVSELARALLAGPESAAASMLMRAAIDPQRLARWRDEPHRDTALPAMLESAGNALARDLSSSAGHDALAERLDRMETSLQAFRRELAEDRKALVEIARTVEAEIQALHKEAVQARTSSKGEAVEAGLETKLGEFGEAMAALAGRLSGVEKLAAGDHWTSVEARLATIEERLAGQTSEMADVFPRMLARHLQPLEDTAERQVTLEASVRASQLGVEEAGKSHDRQLGEIRDAISTLGLREQTLAENLTTWRIEAAGDIGILSNRFQQLEEKMLGLLSSLSGDMQALRHENLDEQAGRGKGFKGWLYGTSNVMAAGWKQEAASIRQTLRRAPKNTS